MKKLLLLVLLLSPMQWGAKAQDQAAQNTQISILTVGPGKNLYDKFGHSAFRVKNPGIGLDEVYNYGTYDFNTPNFYGKFAKGELLYTLSTSRYNRFYNNYLAQDRSISEQVLNLDAEQTQELLTYLHWNKQPENRKYLYDFLFDNCATKIRDILVTVYQGQLDYNASFVEEPLSYRQLIQKHVSWNSWGSLGMDLGIGAVTDRVAPAWDYQFLPEYVAIASGTAQFNAAGGNKPLVASNTVIYQSNYDPLQADALLSSPLAIFLLLAAIIIWVTIRDKKRGRRSSWLDGAIFFLTGLVGSILLFLWFGTQHSTTANNYNILWGFPLSFLLFPLIVKRQAPKWLGRYAFLLVLLIALMGVHQLSGVQQFAPSLLPLLLALVYRYWYLYKHLGQATAP